MSRIYVLFVFSAFAVFTACEKGDIEHETRFERSYEAWQSFKAASGNNYRYEVSGASWAGSSWLTRITVREGKVVQRTFCYEVFNDVRKPAGGWASVPVEELLEGLGFSATGFPEQDIERFHDSLQWTETEAELGLHEQTPASRVQTLDDVYETARTVWLKKRSDAKISFETENDGLISSAGFWPDGCMDDCFSGILIRCIQLIE